MNASLLVGDALTVLRTLPDGAARCCVTSPPYFGLRDYGTGTWEGGNVGCNHIGPPRASDKTGLSHRSERPPEQVLRQASRLVGVPYRDTCAKCGATRVDQQIGLEQTPDAYVARLVEVFREVRRVLADDGTLWLNLGDSYARAAEKGGSGPGGKNQEYSDSYTAAQSARAGFSDGAVGPADRPGSRSIAEGLKPKDLIGVPWRVAFALQADGWYLRQDIIWHKPNPMPESVKDRPTKAHEYLFLLSKSERYFYNGAAIGEPCLTGHEAGPGIRNARSVWTIATRPYAPAHFATMPAELAERCILAGSAPGDTVLDPFGGSGTTAATATGHGRAAIHIDLNPDYHALARNRVGPMFLAGAS